MDDENALLVEALKLSQQRWVDSLPNENELPDAPFSEEYKRKMEELFGISFP